MAEEAVSKNFIEQEIEKDLAEGVYDHVCTRFPPEPNGYLHIGHAKSILLNYGLAQKYNGTFHMRFDDTNPTKEKTEFVESIKADIKWLGADWGDHLYFASDYFDQMYEYAVFLIKKGKAFVCDLTAEQIREYRGTLTEPGKESPYRNRSVEENLQLFEEMKNGKYADGEKVLRAKIDMASPNMNMRDPVIYRVAHLTHHNTGDKWCIYPMYDFAHPIEDAIEHITHSICTLEFEDHRPLYDWVVKECEFVMPPKQIEFAKLYLTNVVTGKRYIKKLVEDGVVDGWDDPRLVTISALRRRGFTPESIRMFVDLCGVAKANSSVDYAMLEYCIREDLKLKRSRVMAVLNPIKLIIDNYPEDQMEELDVVNNLENPELGSRTIPFGRELYIEADDFKIPPLVLQPLVENAYVHGIKPKQGSGSIMIEAHRKEDTLEISVMDNGVGMDQDSIDKILQLLQGDAPGIKNQYNWQSIGLKNVHDRIRYLYGEEYGIQITSTVGVGTMISVILPWNTEEKGESPDDKDDIGG